MIWRIAGAKACFWHQRDAGLYAGMHQAYPFAVDLASAAIANSEAGASFLKEQGCRRDITVIHNGVALPPPQKTRQEWREALGIDASAPVACMVSNLSRNKKHELLLRAWRHGLDSGEIPQQALLAFAGRRDEMAAPLEVLTKTLKLEACVRFLGPVDDVAGLLNAADFGVLSSVSEGLPNAVTEYMHAGLPVVASDIPGVREALGSDRPNAFFPVDSVAGCASALGRMLADAGLRKTAGDRNRARCEEYFSSVRMQARYEELFRAAITEKQHVPLGVWLDIARWGAGRVWHWAKRKGKGLARALLGNKAAAVKRWLEYLHAHSPFAFKVAKTVPDNPKIGFAVLSHERPEYLKVCLDTLFASDITGWDVTFLIHDDGSTNPEVREIIETPRDPRYKIVRVYKPKGHNSWGAAFNSAMRELNRIGDFDILGSCDCDALFHPQWLQKTLAICLWAKKHHKANLLGPFSSYNSNEQDFHGVLGEYDSPFGRYVVKERMGAANYLFFKDDFVKLGRFVEDKNDETIKTEEFKHLSIRNFCTRTSYVEHIGQSSTLDQWRPTPVNLTGFAVNLEEKGWPEELARQNTPGFLKNVKKDVYSGPAVTRSHTSLDVIVCANDDEGHFLRRSVESITKNLRHPIGKIHVLSRQDSEILNLCDKNGWNHLDEDELLIREYLVARGLTSTNLEKGGLARELLKISPLLCNADKFLVVDECAGLAAPQTFCTENGKHIFLANLEAFTPSHFIANMQLAGIRRGVSFSLQSPVMLFDRCRIDELVASVEDFTGLGYREAVFSLVGGDQRNRFSVFELYGQWMYATYRDNVEIYAAGQRFFLNQPANFSEAN